MAVQHDICHRYKWSTNWLIHFSKEVYIATRLEKSDTKVIYHIGTGAPLLGTARQIIQQSSMNAT